MASYAKPIGGNEKRDTVCYETRSVGAYFGNDPYLHPQNFAWNSRDVRQRGCETLLVSNGYPVSVEELDLFRCDKFLGRMD